MKETLITFETAKLAYEKGYTREVVGISFTSTRRNYYNTQGELNGDCTDFIKDVLKYGREKAKINHILYPATSQSLLQKWLREKHGYHIVLIPTITTYWTFKIVNVLKKNTMEIPPYTDVSGKDFTTYEEALEEGLQEALKLI